MSPSAFEHAEVRIPTTEFRGICLGRPCLEPPGQTFQVLRQPSRAHLRAARRIPRPSWLAHYLRRQPSKPPF